MTGLSVAATYAGLACGAAWWCAGQHPALQRLQRLVPSPTGGWSAPANRAARQLIAGGAVLIAVAGVVVVAGGGGLVVVAPALALPVGRALRGRAAAAALRRACDAAAPRVADLVAACVSVGTPPADALDVVRTAVGGPVAVRLAPVVSALRLGSDPVDAYLRGVRDHGTGAARQTPDDALLALVRSVARSVTSGAPLVETARLVADEARRRRRWSAEAAARRAGVLAVGPLIVCYLPAFVLLGVVPLVLGVARAALGDLG